MAIQYVCDRCHSQMSPSERRWLHVCKAGGEQDPDSIFCDLCEECFMELAKMFLNLPLGTGVGS